MRQSKKLTCSMNFNQEKGAKSNSHVSMNCWHNSDFSSFAAILIHRRMQIFTRHSSFLVTQLFSFGFAWICVINWHQCVNSEASEKSTKAWRLMTVQRSFVASRRHNGKNRRTRDRRKRQKLCVTFHGKKKLFGISEFSLGQLIWILSLVVI